MASKSNFGLAPAVATRTCSIDRFSPFRVKSDAGKRADRRAAAAVHLAAAACRCAAGRCQFNLDAALLQHLTRADEVIRMRVSRDDLATTVAAAAAAAAARQ